MFRDRVMQTGHPWRQTQVINSRLCPLDGRSHFPDAYGLSCTRRHCGWDAIFRKPVKSGSCSISDAMTASSVVFTSKAAVTSGLARKLGIDKKLYAVQNTRDGISKKSMIHNGATPKIEVDPETYEVRADGELLTCAPAEVLPMAQRYFMF